MLLISNKIGTLATLLGPFPFGRSFRGILFRALAVANTLAFFLAKPLHAYSGDSGHPFRSIPATCSDPFRPPIPGDSGHPTGGATLELKDGSSANRVGGF